MFALHYYLILIAYLMIIFGTYLIMYNNLCLHNKKNLIIQNIYFNYMAKITIVFKATRSIINNISNKVNRSHLSLANRIHKSVKKQTMQS